MKLFGRRPEPGLAVSITDLKVLLESQGMSFDGFLDGASRASDALQEDGGDLVQKGEAAAAAAEVAYQAALKKADEHIEAGWEMLDQARQLSRILDRIGPAQETGSPNKG